MRALESRRLEAKTWKALQKKLEAEQPRAGDVRKRLDEKLKSLQPAGSVSAAA